MVEASPKFDVQFKSDLELQGSLKLSVDYPTNPSYQVLSDEQCFVVKNSSAIFMKQSRGLFWSS